MFLLQIIFYYYKLISLINIFLFTVGRELPQKEDDEYMEEEEMNDLNETQPEPKLVKLPPVRMGSGKPPRPHKTVHN